MINENKATSDTTKEASVETYRSVIEVNGITIIEPLTTQRAADLILVADLMNKSPDANDNKNQASLNGYRFYIEADGRTVTLPFTAEQIIDGVSAIASVNHSIIKADRKYRQRHPNDTRSWGARVNYACEADISGELPLEMAVCPYCGEVPELMLTTCCSGFSILTDAKYMSQQEEFEQLVMAGEKIESRTLTAEEWEQEEAERERRLEELYGVEVVRNAREAQRAAGLRP